MNFFQFTDVLKQILTVNLGVITVLEDLIRLQREENEMTPEIVRALIAALVALTTLVQTDASNIAASNAARQAAQDALAALQATDTALQDPALVQAANDAIAAAAAATPVTPTP